MPAKNLSLSVGWCGLGLGLGLSFKRCWWFELCSSKYMTQKNFLSFLTTDPRLMLAVAMRKGSNHLNMSPVFFLLHYQCTIPAAFIFVPKPQGAERASLKNPHSGKELWPGESWSVSEIIAAWWIHEFQAIHSWQETGEINSLHFLSVPCKWSLNWSCQLLQIYFSKMNY